MRRRRSNVTLFLAVEAAYVALLALMVRAPLGITLTMLVVSWLLTLPMLPIYLGLVAHLSPHWSPRRQRLAAIGASPMLLTLFAIVLGAWIAPTGLFLFLVALPGSLAFGALVRLRIQPRSTALSTDA